MCKIWDVRSKAATLSFDHGAPIEALSYFPSGEGSRHTALEQAPA